MKAQGRIRVFVKAPHEVEAWMDAEAARPWTNYQISGRRFIANSQDKAGDLVDGMLRLENEQFVVNEVDVDGSAMKTVDFMANVRRIRNHLSGQQRTMKDDSMSLPALRTGGFPSPATTVPHDWCNISTMLRTMRTTIKMASPPTCLPKT